MVNMRNVLTGTWTKIDITSLGEGKTAVIVAASLRTVSARPKNENIYLYIITNL